MLATTCAVLAPAPSHAAPYWEVAPVWEVATRHAPTNLPPGGEGTFHVQVENVGQLAADGAQVEVRLPPGLTAIAAGDDTLLPSNSAWECPDAAGATAFTCTNGPGLPSVATGGPLAPLLKVRVAIDPGASGPVAVRVMVSGGGALNAVTEEEQARIDPAPAAFGVVPGSLGVDVVDHRREPVRQAGSHPFRVTTAFDLSVGATTSEFLGIPIAVHPPQGAVRDVELRWPRGLVANGQAAPQCTPGQLDGAGCPVGSQVGVADVGLQGGVLAAVSRIPVYNMAPPAGTLLDLGFAAGRRAHLRVRLDPSDDGLVGTFANVAEGSPWRHLKLSLWGVPADPLHDADRYEPGSRTFGTASQSPPAPFLTLPSSCAGALPTRLALRSWQGDAPPPSTSAGLELRGCELLHLDAALAVRPATRQADTPTGVDVELEARQVQAVGGLGSAPLRRAVVELPAGMSLSPAALGGLAACSPAQVMLGSAEPPACPDAATVGSVVIETPLLATPLLGAVYVAQSGDDPPFSLYLVAEAAGVRVKLPARIVSNAGTGRLTLTIDRVPELPIGAIRIRFADGPRALLATAPDCGEQTATALLAPWSEAVPFASAVSSFDGDAGDCPQPPLFDPGFVGGMQNPVARRSSALQISVTRPDRHQALGALAISLPSGVTGRFAGVARCGDRDAAAGRCGDASRIGSALLAAGPGPSPLPLRGSVHLTDTYKGAPFGVAIVVPGAVGPFDLGTVVVRGTARIDPATAALRIALDPLPAVFGGMPSRIRRVDLSLDRPGVMSNPSSCVPQRIEATLVSLTGTRVQRGVPFQVADCAALSFRPRASLRIGRRGHTARGASTPLRWAIAPRADDANLRAVELRLPPGLRLRPRLARLACGAAAHTAGRCPPSSVAGVATLRTPLLSRPLTGRVHLVASSSPAAPDLAIDLRGEIDLDLRGSVRTVRGRTVMRLDALPDLGLSQLSVDLRDGRHGVVQATADLCDRRRSIMAAALVLRAHSGRVAHARPRATVSGCRGKARARPR